MTLKEFAKMLDNRSYGNEITKGEEALAKELGFVVVFGYSDDCAELRGAVDDEIACFDGGVLTHDELPDAILAVWCPEDVDCAWAYATPMPHEEFRIFEDDDLYCVGLVCDINKQPAVDAELVKHGRCDYCKDGKSFIGQTIMLANDGKCHTIHYCPNCGAKMDLEG